MKTKAVISVLTKYSECTPNGTSQGNGIHCVRTTTEEGINSLKDLEKEFVEEIKNDCDANDIIFDEDNVEITKNYTDRHYSPNLEVQYYDDESGITFTYEAELFLTEMGYTENDEF